jgi:NADH:quinone reductase (non-electrogenic)
MKNTHVVIVGGGFAGISAAKRLAGESGIEVTLIDRHNYHTFQPLLYQVATSGLEPAEVCPTLRSMFKNESNVRVLLGEMTGLDKDRSVVVTGPEELSYDYLLLAVGGRTTFFGNEEWRALVPGMKGLDDALKVRTKILHSFELAEREADPERVESLLTTVIVGGGPTGVELAGAVAELRNHVLEGQFHLIDPKQARVILIEAMPQLLPGMPESLGRYTKEALEQMGVEVVLEEPVQKLARKRVSTDTQSFVAENIVWAAGVEGYPLSRELSRHTTKKGTIEVRKDLRLKEHDHIFCAGDMIYLENEKGKPLPGLAPVAKQEGDTAAQNILRLVSGQPTKPFHYEDRGAMAVIGRRSAVAHLYSRIPLKGSLAWLAWLFVHLLFLIGFRNRAVVLIRWLWSYLGWRHSARVLNPEYLDVETKSVDQLHAADSVKPTS